MEISLPRSNGEELSAKSLIAISAVASAMLTGLASYFAQSWADEAARRDESKVAEVRAFVDAGQKYRELASSFMQKLTQQQNINEEQKALITNLRDQYTLLETAKESLKQDRYEYATQYQVKIASSIKYLATPVKLKMSEPVVQNLVIIMNDEICVVYYLRDEADLSVSIETSRKCPLP